MRRSPGQELLIGALGDAVPTAHQRLELRERGVNLPGHRALLRVLLDHRDRDLLQLAEDGHRELDELDLVLELGLQAFEGDGVLGVKVQDAVDLGCGRGEVEDASEDSFPASDAPPFTSASGG